LYLRALDVLFHKEKRNTSLAAARMVLRPLLDTEALLGFGVLLALPLLVFAVLLVLVLGLAAPKAVAPRALPPRPERMHKRPSQHWEMG
jgi:hypothetical protein